MRLSRSLKLLFLVLALFVFCSSQAPPTSRARDEAATAAPATVAAAAQCPPLPPPSGTVIDVSSVSQLQSAVNNAVPNTTIRIADGTYHLNGVYLRMDVPTVTLRSASGNREAVVLDGDYVTTEIIQVVASSVTIADLTLREAYYHPIHVVSSAGGDTLGTRIYNVHIIDPGQQAIKINPAAAGVYPDYGEIACSHIELTGAGRAQVWAINGSCYTGGVDAHQARGWVIRDNVIEGFWCASDLSEHGVHLWRGCRDTTVERNLLRNNARGIGFGLVTSGPGRTYPDDPCPGTSGYVDDFGGVIRNNFVSADQGGLFASEYGFDCGICLWNACNGQVLHNTVYTTDPVHTFSAIEWRFPNTDAEIVNNLVNAALRERDGASAAQSGNVTGAPAGWFAGAASGDLHLTPAATGAIDQVAAPAGVSDDVDGQARPFGPASDVGADEYVPPLPGAVTDLRVTHAVTATGVLTAALGWTPPADAVTITLRYASALVTEANWGSAVPLVDALPGTAEAFTATVPYSGGTVYFALKSRNADGWSALSNNAFWPQRHVYLPGVVR